MELRFAAAGGILVAAVGVAGGDRIDGDLPDHADADLFHAGRLGALRRRFSRHGRGHQLFNQGSGVAGRLPGAAESRLAGRAVTNTNMVDTI